MSESRCVIGGGLKSRHVTVIDRRRQWRQPVSMVPAWRLRSAVRGYCYLSVRRTFSRHECWLKCRRHRDTGSFSTYAMTAPGPGIPSAGYTGGLRWLFAGGQYCRHIITRDTGYSGMAIIMRLRFALTGSNLLSVKNYAAKAGIPAWRYKVIRYSMFIALGAMRQRFLSVC
ncbi:hypothetical protein KCP75_14520 [Salmonella enterica subsp. enterica]|nr:hypothetical protein KCP75_14520 [Salmonella enterica subsp. enterica]